MLARDAFARWLGIGEADVTTGFGESRLRVTVRADMLNGHGTLHGGVTHAIAGAAFAFAANSHGVKAVAAETSMSYLKPLRSGDAVECHVRELSRGRKLGRYEATLTRAQKPVALFRATCFYLDEHWGDG